MVSGRNEKMPVLLGGALDQGKLLCKCGLSFGGTLLLCGPTKVAMDSHMSGLSWGGEWVLGRGKPTNLAERQR